MTTIRVLLADEHNLFRASLRALLQSLDGVDVVAEAADGMAVVQLAATLHPDVVVMSVGLPRMNGWDATAELARTQPGPHVLLLAEEATDALLTRAAAAGARGYLLTSATVRELDNALRAVARGTLSARLAHALLAQGEPGAEPRIEADRLTLRQREIVQLIAEGNSSKQVADLLGLSVRTVDHHRAQLMARLGVHSVADLVRWAIRSGVATTTTP